MVFYPGEAGECAFPAGTSRASVQGGTKATPAANDFDMHDLAAVAPQFHFY
jgi:hypothetical protein